MVCKNSNILINGRPIKTFCHCFVMSPLTSALLSWVREHQELDDDELQLEFALIPTIHIRGILDQVSQKRKRSEDDLEKDEWCFIKQFLVEIAPLTMKAYNLTETTLTISNRVKNPATITKIQLIHSIKDKMKQNQFWELNSTGHRIIFVNELLELLMIMHRKAKKRNNSILCIFERRTQFIQDLV